MPSVEIGFIDDPARPVLAFRADVAAATCAGEHAHPRAQVIFASRGVMHVLTARSAWLVPPSQAVWLPSQVAHQVSFPGAVAIRNLFIDPGAAADLPQRCQVFAVTPLLRELILRLCETGPQAAAGPAAGLGAVILDELRAMRPAPLELPLSDEPRLRRVMDALIVSPAEGRPLADWARQVHTTARTLARLFARETGMTFGAWRAQLRMLEALDRLSRGQAVTQVALNLGYRNVSAFIEAFRRTMGTTPGKYFHDKE